jgi:hypothetical protein
MCTILLKKKIQFYSYIGCVYISSIVKSRASKWLCALKIDVSLIESWDYKSVTVILILNTSSLL